MRRLAIDPGDIHVGWAYDATDGVSPPEVGEWTPTECVDQVVRLMTLDVVDEIILEEFILYGNKAKEQSWSKMKTSQLIGGLKVVAYFFRIPVVEQGAYIKKPTAAKMRALGIVRVAKDNIHASDAELHLKHRIMRSGA